MKFIKLILLALPAFLAFSCKKKDSGMPPNPPIISDCKLVSEETSLLQNERVWDYAYDGANKLIGVKSRPAGGSAASPDNTWVVGNESVLWTPRDYDRSSLVYANSGTITSLRPLQESVDMTEDNITRNAWWFEYEYNGAGQVISILEHTEFVGDNEWGVSISYNDQGNVTKLQYIWHTGPPQTIPPILVTGYDDKPTPYANIPAWKFYLLKFSWDNYDPEPVLTALSKNNPTGYTMGSGTDALTRTMSYTYNSNGFPTQRSNTNTNAGGSYTFLQNFTYECP